MSKMLGGGGSAAKPTTNASAANIPQTVRPGDSTGASMGATMPAVNGPVAGIDAPNTIGPGPGYDASGNPNTKIPKKKLDWQGMVKSGLTAAAGSMNDQQDPMAVLQQMQNMAQQSQGRVY